MLKPWQGIRVKHWSSGRHGVYKANLTGEYCLLKVVQPLVWRLLGLHKIQMPDKRRKKKRGDAFSEFAVDDVNPLS